MALDLNKDVFQMVLPRIRQRADSLRTIWRFDHVGMEGWLKVETVVALGQKVSSVNNRGPDLTLEDGTRIEIKAATHFYRTCYITGPLRRYAVPVLFLSGRAGVGNLKKATGGSFEVVACDVVSDGDNTWLLGMVKPKQAKM